MGLGVTFEHRGQLGRQRLPFFGTGGMLEYRRGGIGGQPHPVDRGEGEFRASRPMSHIAMLARIGGLLLATIGLQLALGGIRTFYSG